MVIPQQAGSAAGLAVTGGEEEPLYAPHKKIYPKTVSGRYRTIKTRHLLSASLCALEPRA